LSIRQINFIFKEYLERKNTSDSNVQKSIRTADVMAAAAAAIYRGWRLTIFQLATMHDLNCCTVYFFLSKDLGLVKKPTGWVSKFLSSP
jgi:hypothetical protein